MIALAKRLDGIEESATLALSSRVKELRGEGRDIVELGSGEPDFDTPEHIKRAAAKAMKLGYTKYTPVGGIPELKEAIIEKFKKDNNISYSQEEILISCGGKHSFYNLCQAILDPGDEVLIPSPYWVSYPQMVKLAGGVPEIIPTSESTGFKVTAGHINEYITPHTKAVVINSPNNPTGSVYTAEELHDIAYVAMKKDILIISDEIYERFVYDDVNTRSIASFSEEVKNRTIVINGVSKTYSMTGWRIGYAAGPREIIKAMTDIQSQSTSNPTSISQWAALEAITGPQDAVDEMVEEFQRRRKIMVEGLNSIKDVTCIEPRGAFYAFPNVSRFFWRSYKDKTIKGSVDLADYLLETAGVAVVPGDAFGEDSCIRLSYATSEENIKKGLERIATALERLE